MSIIEIYRAAEAEQKNQAIQNYLKPLRKALGPSYNQFENAITLLLESAVSIENAEEKTLEGMTHEMKGHLIRRLPAKRKVKLNIITALTQLINDRALVLDESAYELTQLKSEDYQLRYLDVLDSINQLTSQYRTALTLFDLTHLGDFTRTTKEIREHEQVCLQILKQKAAAIRWNNIWLKITDNTIVSTIRSVEITVKHKPLSARDITATSIGILSAGIAIGGIMFSASENNSDCECPQLPV